MSPFRLFKLKNGIKTVTWHSPTAHAVAVLVLVRTGSRNETKDINGISHFLEHMMFKATKKRPTHIEIVKELDGVGASYNAFTSKEYTGFYVVVDAARFDLALDILSDILINSTIPPEEVEKERGVIIEEINMYLDEPMRHISDLWEELLYGDQPAGWNIAGTKEGIATMPREEFVRYFNDQYTAPNSILCIAGNFDKKAIRRKVQKYFGPTPGALPKRKMLKVREVQKAPALLVEGRTTDQMHLMLGVRSYNVFDPKKYALSLLEVILGGNMSSRLWHEVREKRGLAYYVSSDSEFYTDCGFFVTRAGVNVTKAEETVKIIVKEYRKIAREGVTDDEILMAKNYLRGRLHLGLETASQKASFMGLQEVLIDKVLAPKEIERNILKVRTKDVQKIAREIFKNNKLNLCMVGPVENKERIKKILTF